MTQIPDAKQFGKVVGSAALVWLAGLLIGLPLPAPWGRAVFEFGSTMAWGVLLLGLMPFVSVRAPSANLRRLLQWLWVALAFVFAVVTFMKHDGLTKAETIGVVALMAGLVVAFVPVARVIRREFTSREPAAQSPVR